MSVIDFDHYGGPEVLVRRERNVPKLESYEVLIKVFAVGVNRPDIIQRMGHYAPPVGASDLLGLEASGEIVARGSKVSKWEIGEKVTALLHGGGYAEFVSVNEKHCLPIPCGLSMIEAAGLCETYFTVWANIFSQKVLKFGESFLVHGGSSGIGIAAIQLAKISGAQVFTTVGNEEKKRFCEALGAKISVNYKETDFLEVFKQSTKNIGIDVILDMVGGSYIEKNISLLARDGRLIMIAFLEGSKAEINFVRLMLKRLVITGSTLRSRSDSFKAKIAEELYSKVWPLLVSGEIKPVVDKVFPLSRVREAHLHMESSKHIGKIILNVDKP